MILGMASLLFGLLGFRVRCICYSEYLSWRDYNLFAHMFEDFGVSHLITYSKITTFSEDQIAQKGDIRGLTHTLLHGQSLSTTVPAERQALPNSSSPSALSAPSPLPSQLSQPPLPDVLATPSSSPAAAGPAVPDAHCGKHAQEILLVDEVDMFFGKDFYGKTHNQIVLIDAPEVSAILREVWGRRHSPDTPHCIAKAIQQTSQHYRALLHRFPGWAYIIENEVTAMCHDMREFDTPQYHFSRATDSIGYRNMDSICYDILHGYRTAFAYLNEENNLKNPTKVLSEALRLRVPCGQFSHANINFDIILGVSGTVAALGEQEWGIMNKYGIDMYTMMPSVYGLSNFKFLDQQGGEPITVTQSRDEQFMAITEEVNAKIQDKQDKRAVIVVFQDFQILDEYKKSSYFGRIPRKNVLTEKLNHEEKEFIIKKAATSGQATFTSAMFGRGTDFFCNDQKLQKAGGVHVIQAFFSLCKSEEVQIQGRTARQGKKGTYSMILLEKDLRKQLDTKASFGVPPQDLYKLLEQERCKMQRKTYKDVEKELQAANKRDALSHRYFDALLAHDTAGAKTDFKDLYDATKVTVGSKGSHVVFCLDESGSMDGKPWQDLMAAFRSFLQRRADHGGSHDLVSVVQFGSSARISVKMQTVAQILSNADLSFMGGGTEFRPALNFAKQLFQMSAQMDLEPVFIFMSDGQNGDGDMSKEVKDMHAAFGSLQCHMIFFGSAGSPRLQSMAAAVPNGQYHLSVDGVQLLQTFEAIAVGAEFKAACV